MDHERSRPRLFGVVLAGGQSRRYGSPKARVRLGGIALLERSLGILRATGLETGVIANQADHLPAPWADDPYAKGRAGARPSGGAQPARGARGQPADQPPVVPPSIGGAGREGGDDLLAGSTQDGEHVAVAPVRADLRPGAGPLGGLHAALCWARERGDAGVFLLGCDLPLVPPNLVGRLVRAFDPARPTVPASPGPLGVEPLCACYPVNLVPAVEESLGAGRFGMGEFVRASNPVVVTRDELASVAGVRHAFLNVNTPADREHAARLLGSSGGPG